MPARNCPNCGAELPPTARFCLDCGVRIAGADADTTLQAIPPDETGQVPVNVTAAEPRYFGVTPPLAVLTLSVASLAAAIVFLLRDALIPGVLLLVAAAAFAGVFAAVARRLPQNPAVRVSAGLVDRIRRRAGYAVETVSVHSSARLELLRLRRELAELVARRTEAVRAFGEAVYGERDEEAANARNRLQALDEALAAKEGEMTRVANEARERIERARLEVRPTAVVDPPQVPEPMPVPSEPPGPVTVPEPSPVPSEPPMPVPAPDPTPEPSPPQPEPPQGS